MANSNMDQYIKACKCRSKEDKERRKQQVEACHHEFAILDLMDDLGEKKEQKKELEPSSTNFASIIRAKNKSVEKQYFFEKPTVEVSEEVKEKNHIIECVHCGLTNKYIQLEERLVENGWIVTVPKGLQSLGYKSHIYGTNVEPNPYENELFKGFHFDFNKLPYLSKKFGIPSHHIGLLYKMALSIYPTATKEQLWDVMRELHETENSLEHFMIETEEQEKRIVLKYLIAKKKNTKRSLIRR